MKKALVAFAMLTMTAPAHADIVHKLTSSIQLTVNAPATQIERIGSSFSISGNGVSTTDGTTAGTISAGTITSGVYAPGTISAAQHTDGNSFSFSQSYTEADALSTSAPTLGTVGNFSNQTSTAAGTAGDLAGTISTTGAISVTAGGAGTLGTGQFVTELTIK